jgi:hypothetical protein
VTWHASPKSRASLPSSTKAVENHRLALEIVGPRSGGTTRTPGLGIVILAIGRQTTSRLSAFRYGFYKNPGLQVRVLPAASEMVTTLVARLSDWLAPIAIFRARVMG